MARARPVVGCRSPLDELAVDHDVVFAMIPVTGVFLALAVAGALRRDVDSGGARPSTMDPLRSMHRFRCSLLLAAALGACAPGGAAAPSVSDPALQDALLRRVAADQAVRDTFATQLRATGTITPELAASMRAVDSANLAWLKPQLRQHGFPSRRAVGKEGVQAAALLVQHADADPAFQAEVLPLLEAAFRAGEVPGQEVAMLTDRVAKARGRPQRYGTQTTIVDGRVIFDPIDDSAGVDTRRAAMGLPPLAEYKAALDSLFGQPGGP